MSRELDEVRRLVNARLRENGETALYGTIEKVDSEARTCDVKVGGVVYDGVLLYAVEKNDLKGFVALPKKGSTVIVSRLGASSRMFVEMFSEIDRLLVTIGDKMELEIDAEGVRLKADNTSMLATSEGLTLTRGSSGLKKTLGDLCDAISALTVTTGVGPSGIPINKAQFDAIKQDLNNWEPLKMPYPQKFF